MRFTFVLYAPKAYIHMVIQSLDENIVHETLVTKSDLFRDSLQVKVGVKCVRGMKLIVLRPPYK